MATNTVVEYRFYGDRIARTEDGVVPSEGQFVSIEHEMENVHDQFIVQNVFYEPEKLYPSRTKVEVYLEEAP